MPLVKAKIIADYDGVLDTFNVLFNPEEYDFSLSNNVKKNNEKPNKSILQYSGNVNKNLSMKLYFDTYAENKSVKTYTDKLVSMIKPKCIGNKFIQPKLTFLWGDLCFQGLMKNIVVNFTMFSREGIPVRANTTITITESKESEEGEEMR